MLVTPLSSCSARLPVYSLMIGAFVPGGALTKGLVMLGMYSLGVLVALPTAWVFRKTLFRGQSSPFIMELPTYKWPRVRESVMSAAFKGWDMRWLTEQPAPDRLLSAAQSLTQRRVDEQGVVAVIPVASWDRGASLP